MTSDALDLDFNRFGFSGLSFIAEQRQSTVSLDEQKNRKNTNVRLFKEQQDQLQQQQNRGEIDAEQYQRLVMDAQRLLLANTELDVIGALQLPAPDGGCYRYY